MPIIPPFLVQLAPFNDVIPNETSDQYTNQLQVGQGNASNTPPYVFTTVTPSPAFTVSSAGIVSTTALLQPGSYTAWGPSRMSTTSQVAGPSRSLF